MLKIVRLSLSIAASGSAGYALTASLYFVGDRSPSEVREYDHLSHDELSELISSLTYAWRPGWEYSRDAAQPSFLQD